MTMQQRVVFLAVVVVASALASSSSAEPKKEYGKIAIVRDGCGPDSSYRLGTTTAETGEPPDREVVCPSSCPHKLTLCQREGAP